MESVNKATFAVSLKQKQQKTVQFTKCARYGAQIEEEMDKTANLFANAQVYSEKLLQNKKQLQQNWQIEKYANPKCA